MGLFGRRRGADPSSWDELWEVLAPLGGALTPEAVSRWEDVVATSPPAFLEAASEQLAYAYRLLGTEAHAREIGPGAFAGTDHPFAAERFARVVDAVVVAGPDAVARVAKDPAAIRAFAAAVPLRDPALAYRADETVPLGVELLRLRDRARFERGAELRAPRTAGRLAVSATHLDKDALRAWPSLSGRAPRQAWAGIPDPETPWLDVDASFLDGAPEGDDRPGDRPADDGSAGDRLADDGPAGDLGSWYACGLRAAERVYAALGPAALGGPVRTVTLEVEVRVPAGSDGGTGAAADDGHGLDVHDEVLVAVLLDPSDAPTTDPDARVGVLVRACARRLLDLPLVATPRNREALTILAAG